MVTLSLLERSWLTILFGICMHVQQPTSGHHLQWYKMHVDQIQLQNVYKIQIFPVSVRVRYISRKAQTKEKYKIQKDVVERALV